MLGYDGDQLVAYTRLLPKGVSYPSVSMGRVAISADHRGGGIGHQLLEESLKNCQSLWPDESIEIGAQEYLTSFYTQHGFVKTSDTYLEDNIPHIDMKLAK